MQYIVDIQTLNHHFEIIIRSFALTTKSTAKNKKYPPPKKNNKKPKKPKPKTKQIISCLRHNAYFHRYL